MINRLVIDFIKEGIPGGSIYRLLQIKTVRLDYHLQQAKEKLLPNAKINVKPFQ